MMKLKESSRLSNSKASIDMPQIALGDLKIDVIYKDIKYHSARSTEARFLGEDSNLPSNYSELSFSRFLALSIVSFA